MAERIIGIDFGTSTSAIRVRRYEGKKALKPDPVTFNGAPKVPTLIQTIEDGQACYYGYDADVQKRRATVYRNFKLDLESGDAEKQEKARELTAEYLRYLGQVYRHQSEGGFLGDSGDTVKTFVSYPVRWSENTRAFMLQAARDAGFPAVEGLDEAEASIRAVTEQYADLLTGKGYFRADRPCTILLIDMGAGTTDLVLCRHMPGEAAKTEILCTWPQGGEALFGGSRVDALLYKYITDSFPDMQAVARLPLSKFKAWKEELVSPALQRGESVDYFEALKPIEDALDVDLCFEPIDRARFETLAADYLPELPKLVAGALAAAKLEGDAVDLVLLTGGHSQWYFVREMLLGHMPQFGELRLGKIAADPGRIVSIARPEETVALGLVCKSVSLVFSKTDSSNGEGQTSGKENPPQTALPKDADEQYELAMAYYADTGKQQNPQMAVRLFRMAAEQGHPQAQYYLGLCYKDGHGCSHDSQEAFKWLTMAYKNGVSLAENTILLLTNDHETKTVFSEENRNTHNRVYRVPTPENQFQIGVSATNSSECLITKYIGTDMNVVIPERIRGYRVCAIGEKAFSPNRTLLGNAKHNLGIKKIETVCSVVIPKTVRQIQNKAFYDCLDLEEVALHEDIQYIGREAFYGCPNLKKLDFGCGYAGEGIVYFPKTLKSIGVMAFTTGDYYGFRCIIKKAYISRSTMVDEPTLLDKLNYSNIGCPKTFDGCELTYY